jgi:hypothetical protein
MNELQIVNPNKLIAFYQTTRHGFIWSTQRESGTVAIAHHRSFCNEIMPPIYFAMVKVWTVVLKWRHYDATKSQKLFSVQLNWNKTGTNKEIIANSKTDCFWYRRLQSSRFWKYWKYDFDPKTAGSENAVMRLFNYMIKKHLNSNSFKTTIMNRRHFLTLTGTFRRFTSIAWFSVFLRFAKNLVIGEQCVFCTIKWWKWRIKYIHSVWRCTLLWLASKKLHSPKMK